MFNRLRINPPLPPHYKHERKGGLYVTDVWDDIRELTTGYFAGDEALRNPDGSRFHKQQSPVPLLLRIILASSMPGDIVLDPFAGTGTTLVVAAQLSRNAIGIEKSAANVECIHKRLQHLRAADCIDAFYETYKYTERLDALWGKSAPHVCATKVEQHSSVEQTDDNRAFAPLQPPGGGQKCISDHSQTQGDLL